MEDTIKALFPKEKPDGHEQLFSHRNGYCTCSYNQAIKEVHALIPQIVEVVYDDLRGKIEVVRKRHTEWKPTEGHGSEEELGYQKGLIAEAKLFAHDVLSLLSTKKEA